MNEGIHMIHGIYPFFLYLLRNKIEEKGAIDLILIPISIVWTEYTYTARKRGPRTELQWMFLSSTLSYSNHLRTR